MQPTVQNDYNISLHVCNCVTFNWCNAVRKSNGQVSVPAVLCEDFMYYLQKRFPALSFQAETAFVVFHNPSEITDFIQTVNQYHMPAAFCI